MTKKEIGMGKLMKYVEEMQKEGINICRPQVQEYYILRMILISKHYGLIKWLVENDKIETEKVGEIGFIGKYDFETNYYLVDEDNVYDKCETLLMLLSISDTPIDDLISYLK